MICFQLSGLAANYLWPLAKTGDLGYIDALPFAPFPHLITAGTMC